MNSFHLILTSASFALSLSSAQAATTSSNGNSGKTAGQDGVATVTLDLFDGNLGTLTGAFFEYDMRAEAVYFLKPGNAASGNALANDDFVSFMVSSFGPGLTQFPVMQARDGEAFSTSDIFNYSQFVEGSDSGSIARNINGWTGSGSTDLAFQLQLLQMDASSVEVFSDFREVFYDVSVKVTYTYDPIDVTPVPLPAGLPLLAVSVGAFGLLRRKRKF